MKLYQNVKAIYIADVKGVGLSLKFINKKYGGAYAPPTIITTNILFFYISIFIIYFNYILADKRGEC